jgi:hypothetical protein
VLLGVLAAAPLKVALPNWSVSRVDPVAAQALELRFAARLGAQGLEVSAQRDIVAALTQERQRQLLGCSDENSSCLVELAGALGVDAIVSGVLARQGSGYLVTLRVIRASDAALLDARSASARSLAAVQDWVDASAPAIAAAARKAFGRELVAAPRPSLASPSRALPWALVGVGGAAAIAGGTCFGLSKSDAARLASASPAQPLTATEAGAVARRGSTLEAAGLGLLIGGGAALAAGALWLALAGSGAPPPPVALWVTPQGAGLSARF